MHGRATRWVGLTGGGLLAIAAWASSSGIADALYVAVGLFAVLVCAAALRLRTDIDRAGWGLVVASQALWVAGDVLYTLERGTNAIGPIPSPMDLVYLAGYPLLVAGIIRLRPWDAGRGATELIDGTIAAIAVGLFVWVLVVVPVVENPVGTFSSRFVDAAYPVLDLLAMGVAMRLVLGRVRRSAAGLLTAGAMVPLLAADIHYGSGALVHDDAIATFTNLGWLASYVAIAVAIVHPSAAAVAAPPADREQRGGRGRLAALAILATAGLVIAMVEALDGRTVGIVVLAAAASALLLLAVVRIGLLARSLEGANREVRLRDRALASVGSGIVIIDATVPDGHILDVNPAFERITGYSREELLGRSVATLLGGGADPAAVHRLNLTLTTGGEANARILGCRKGGETFWSELRLTPVQDGSQQAGTMVGILNDVTDQVWAERELRFQAELLDQAFAAVSATDTSGTVTHWNRHAEELYGWTHAQAIGRRASELGIGPEDDGTTAEIATALLAGERWEGDYQARCRGGEQRWVRASTSPVLDTAGAICGVVTVATDIAEQKAAEAALEHQAFYDDLTGLPNRSFLTDRLNRLTERTSVAGRGSAVLFIDLDRFKGVNDHLGHGVGDELLRAAAARLQAALRGDDVLARFGGDEFVAVLADVDAKTAIVVADRMREAMKQSFICGGHELFVQASIGVAIPGDGQSPSDLLSAADIALYRAKSAGRNRTVLYQSGMEAHAATWFALESELRRALEHGGELVVHYQPIVDLHSGRVDCLEALVRWSHPERGLLPPGDFLPMAETSELIGQVGAWVIGEACRNLREWADARPDLQMPILNVNIAARQLHEPDFVDRVSSTLAANWLRPDEIRLEITEQVLIEELRATSATLRGLEHLGVRFAIDDFGAGASSLAALRELRADVLKLDRGFARDLAADQGNRAIVRAVAALAHELGIFVTAEGIESPEQLAVARELGCDNGQGFLFAYPLSAGEVLPFLEQAARNGILPGSHAADVIVPFRRRTG